MEMNIISFNTASGMDCMQYYSSPLLKLYLRVSIPQAVWIACNYSRFNKIL